MHVLFCVRSFLKRWRFLKSIHNSLFSASIFSISECSGCLLTGAVPGQAGALKYSSCCVSDQLVLTLVIVLYLIVSIFCVSSIILCYRYFDGDKYNKTIRGCLSGLWGRFFAPVLGPLKGAVRASSSQGQTATTHRAPLGGRKLSLRLRTVRPLFRAGVDGLGVA